jgi:hypothetical protein
MASTSHFDDLLNAINERISQLDDQIFRAEDILQSFEPDYSGDQLFSDSEDDFECEEIFSDDETVVYHGGGYEADSDDDDDDRETVVGEWEDPYATPDKLHQGIVIPADLWFE